ncbi:MAG: hypothetical protein IT282_14300 [Bacteroidetes bacterium]|nr:hypothetical protein [Bacteroidota bacterium]
MTRRWLRTSAATLLLFAAIVFGSHDALAQKQYLVVNIVPGEKYEPVFEQVRDLARRDSSGRLELGIGAIFSYLHQSRVQCTADVIEFLSLSGRYGIPIVVQLDGEQWWEARPDLWNWWDPGRPGFDPANRMNVEWSGWGSEYAMKIAWRNWGRQIRVLPPPNFMSQAYRAACHAEMRALIPLILRWWENLPEGKKSLLIGIKLGWESAIGVNSFYLPGGNALLDLPEEEDPQVKLQGERIPDRGVAAIGYAAVMTAQMADSGILQEAHLAEITRWHLEDLCALARNLGVPREKLFTHVGGWKDEELLYDAAFNSHSCPGWSFYRHAGDPAKDLGVQRVLGRSDAPYWAAAEWLLEGRNTPEAWHSALQRSLSDPTCRYVCIYNWSGIRDDPAAVEAIQRILHDRSEPSTK